LSAVHDASFGTNARLAIFSLVSFMSSRRCASAAGHLTNYSAPGNLMVATYADAPLQTLDQRDSGR